MGGSSWWVTLLSALAGGAIALAGALVNGTYDRRRARREEWFRRVQWAQHLTLSDDARAQEAGYRMLKSLADSDLSTSDDLRMLYNLTENTGLMGLDLAAMLIEEDTEATSSTSSADEDDQ